MNKIIITILMIVNTFTYTMEQDDSLNSDINQRQSSLMRIQRNQRGIPRNPNNPQSVIQIAQIQQQQPTPRISLANYKQLSSSQESQ